MILHLSLAPSEIFTVVLGKFQIRQFQCSQNLQEHKVPGHGSSKAEPVAKISLKSVFSSFPAFLLQVTKPSPAALHCPTSFALFPQGTGQLKHCLSKGDYLCFEGLADEERESSPHPASSKPGGDWLGGKVRQEGAISTQGSSRAGLGAPSCTGASWPLWDLQSSCSSGTTSLWTLGLWTVICKAKILCGSITPASPHLAWLQAAGRVASLDLRTLGKC